MAGSAFSGFVERFTRRGEPERHNMDTQTDADANTLRREYRAQARDARRTTTTRVRKRCDTIVPNGTSATYAPRHGHDLTRRGAS